MVEGAAQPSGAYSRIDGTKGSDERGDVDKEMSGIENSHFSKNPGVAGEINQVTLYGRRHMRKSMTAILFGLVLTAFAIAPVVAQTSTDTATLAAGGYIGNVNSTAAFTAGADSTMTGYVTAVGAVTIGAGSSVANNVTAGAAFTSGDSAKIGGSVSAKAAFTSGANSTIGGNATVGADFTSGANSVINGNVYVTGSVTLGAGSRIIGTVHSSTGVITYGAGATIGGVV